MALVPKNMFCVDLFPQVSFDTTYRLVRCTSHVEPSNKISVQKYCSSKIYSKMIGCF